MWEGHEPGYSRQRGVPCSNELYDAVNKCAKDSGYAIQFIFDSALFELWSLWNGGNNVNMPESMLTQERLRRILFTSKPPGKINDHHKNELYVRFNGDLSYEWFGILEKESYIRSFASGIRRVFTYYMMKLGYLEKTFSVHDVQIEEEASDEKADVQKVQEKPRKLSALFH